MGHRRKRTLCSKTSTLAVYVRAFSAAWRRAKVTTATLLKPVPGAAQPKPNVPRRSPAGSLKKASHQGFRDLPEDRKDLTLVRRHSIRPDLIVSAIFTVSKCNLSAARN